MRFSTGSDTAVTLAQGSVIKDQETAQSADAAAEADAQSPVAADPLAGLLGASPEQVLGDRSSARDRRRMILALQRSAGNSAVNRLLRQVAPPALDSDEVLDEPVDEEAVAAGPPTPRLLPDGQERLADHQLNVGEFFAQLRPRVCALAEERLGEMARGCPWVDYWIGNYRGRDPAEIEQIVARYAPAAGFAPTAQGMIEAIVARVGTGIESWQATGEVNAPVAFQREPGAVRHEAEATDVLGRLGAGRPLDPAVASRMGSALGGDFSGVVVHDDSASAATTRSLGARALAVGNHIAFAPNTYDPGTPVGDALIAHELAHVLQQGEPALAREPTDEARLERDADAVAMSAMDVLHGGRPGARGTRTALRSGLRLQRCGRNPAPANATPTRATASGTNLLAGTHVATATQHAEIEAILHPGSTLVPVALPPGSPPGTPAPPPVVAPPPAMTGAGAGGAFETEMVTAVRTYIGQQAAAFNALSAAGGAISLPEFHDLARVAQRECERHFSAWIDAASRQSTDVYHRGTYDLVTQLNDMATMPVNAGLKRWWANYWMHQSGVGGPILTARHVVSPRDDAEVARVANMIATDPALQADIEATVHGWPGFTQGTAVYIQRIRDVSTVDLQRRARWDIFTTLIHEMIHKLEHPNFGRAHAAFQGDAQMILREGFCDLMRHDLWDGPTGLRARLESDAALRQSVEGAAYPFDANVVVYHGDYAQLAEARQIRDRIGMDNCKAAFFLGRTEMLGFGPTSGTVTPLTGIANWTPSDETDAEIYVTVAGDTAALVALKLGVDASAILRPDGSAVPAGWTPAVGERVRVAGLRYVHAITGDTLGSIARQHGVSVNAVAAANNFPSGSTGATAVPAGGRIIIPVRRS